jgi:hypothetical protein
MAEYTQNRWRCDWCGRDVKKGDAVPSGWHESADFYGNTWHCCADPTCQMQMVAFNRENGHQIPEALKSEEGV